MLLFFTFVFLFYFTFYFYSYFICYVSWIELVYFIIVLDYVNSNFK